MRRNFRLSRWPLAMTATFGLITGCNALFGLDEVEPLPTETVSSSSSSAASGGTGGGTSTSSAGGATSSSSSTGGGGNQGGGGGVPAVCDVSTLGTASGCGSNMKCSVTNVQTGTPGCVPAGPRVPWSACTVDSQCEAGTFCDLILKVCKPVCTNATCQSGNCIQAEFGNGNIPNLMVCVADCEPVGATPCSQSPESVSCVRKSYGMDCEASDGLPYNADCSVDHQCAPGLVCWNNSKCYDWCTIGGTPCQGLSCLSLSPAAMSGDGMTEYGFCGLFSAP